MSCSNVGGTRVEMTMFEIVDCITEITRTILYTSPVKYPTQPFFEGGKILLFALSCRYILDPGYLRPRGSVERFVAVLEKPVPIP